MRQLIHFAGFILLMLVLVQGEEISKEVRQCNKERKRLMVGLKKRIDICLTKVSSSTGDEASIRGCIAKCVFRMEKALDENDDLTEASFRQCFESRFTGQTRDLLLQVYRKCEEKFGAVAKSDELCTGYESLGLCIESGFYTLCEDLQALIAPPTEDEDASKTEL
ncbi:unnamed protein product [Allacma fusca]|uniref:Uncharacterized protein n=1 Tax=Allacma fusca TaxID=39272 RepID=A0A8J2M8V4_9HEXA|nr:unnamed protein product [Allacma fusca]